MVESDGEMMLRLSIAEREKGKENMNRKQTSLSSRRSFLKTSSGVLAAPLIVSTTALGRAGAAAPSERITLGMIGTGRQCYHKNIPLFQRQEDVQIVAACDVDSWRLGEAAKRIDAYEAKIRDKDAYQACDTTVDYREILSRDDIDAVVISTPDHWHAKMALEAMAAGKDVALEKPIIRTIDDGKKLVAASKKYGRVFRVDSEFRSGKYARGAYALAKSGRLGKIHTAHACVPETDVPCPPQPEMPVPEELDYQRWLGPAPEAPYTLKRVHPRQSWSRPGWMRHLDYCDGMVTNWGTHLVNGTLWCLGLDRSWPTTIEGTGVYPAPESFWNVPLSFDITYTYPDVTVHYRTERPYLRLEGENGWVEAGFGSIKAEPQSLLEGGFDLVDSPPPRYTSEKIDFIHSVKTREETLEPAEVGHCVTSTCLLGHLAFHLQEKLTWDGEKEQFVDNAKANEMLDQPIRQPNPQLQQEG
jgi:predicted dehydrogenase